MGPIRPSPPLCRQLPALIQAPQRDATLRSRCPPPSRDPQEFKSVMNKLVKSKWVAVWATAPGVACP